MSVLLRFALCLLHLTLSPTGPSNLGFVSAVLSLSAGFSVSLYILNNRKNPITNIKITNTGLRLSILNVSTLNVFKD